MSSFYLTTFLIISQANKAAIVLFELLITVGLHCLSGPGATTKRQAHVSKPSQSFHLDEVSACAKLFVWRRGSKGSLSDGPGGSLRSNVFGGCV